MMFNELSLLCHVALGVSVVDIAILIIIKSI